MNARTPLLLVLATACALPQSAGLPPGILLLSRIKAHVKSQVAHMPQYTCLETLERFYKGNEKKAVNKQLDTVRLEVLFAGHKEFFASPGAHDFQDEDPGKYIATGMIGTGMFAGHLQTLFVDDNGTFEYRGEEAYHGRRAAHFDFRVPLLRSGYTIVVPGARAQVAMKGTFWADPVTYDLIHLEISADEIPPVLQTAEILTTVDFERTQIGEEEVMLAQGGTITMVREYGQRSFDRFDFTHCRAYRAESSISFGDAGPAMPPSSETKPRATLEPLPAGLSVTIALNSPLTERSNVGEIIDGKIVGDVTARGSVLIPGGAIVHGRVRRLDTPPMLPGYHAVGLEFTDIEGRGGSLRFFADLQSADPVPGLEWKPLLSAGQGSTAIERAVPPDLPGVGTFFLRGERFMLPAGFRMVWKTRAM